MPITQAEFEAVFNKDPFDLVLELVFHQELPEHLRPLFKSTRRQILRKTMGLQPHNKLDIPPSEFVTLRAAVFKSIRAKLGVAALNLHHVICTTLEYCDRAERFAIGTISQIGQQISDQLVAMGMAPNIAILIASIALSIQSLDLFCNCPYQLNN
jgi:hypothetical protein